MGEIGVYLQLCTNLRPKFFCYDLFSYLRHTQLKNLPYLPSDKIHNTTNTEVIIKIEHSAMCLFSFGGRVVRLHPKVLRTYSWQGSGGPYKVLGIGTRSATCKTSTCVLYYCSSSIFRFVFIGVGEGHTSGSQGILPVQCSAAAPNSARGTIWFGGWNLDLLLAKHGEPSLWL